MKEIICTGKTEKELVEELENIEQRQASIPKKCYLCHRQEGETSVCVDSGTDVEEEMFILNKIVLRSVTREFASEGLIFSFEICSDCAILLNELNEDEGFTMTDFFKRN